MVAGDEALDCKNLVSCECAEDVGDSQCLGISVKDDICSSYSFDRGEGLLFVRVAIYVGSEQEPIGREFRHADSSEESYWVCWILVLDNCRNVDYVRDFFRV